MKAVQPRGWCPGLFTPMESGDGLLVRVRPPSGALSASAVRTLADAATQCGNGLIELTQRAALQVRGLRLETLGLFADLIVAAGLAESDPARERRRVVVHPPLADPARSVAAAIEAELQRQHDLDRLPPKFCVSVDVGDVGADVAVTLDGSSHAVVRPATVGPPWGAMVSLSDAPAAVARVARAFVGLAAALDPPPTRMRALAAIQGADLVLRAASLLPVLVTSLEPVQVLLGHLPHHQGFGLGLPFGSSDAAVWRHLASLADTYGDGTLRLAPCRAVVFTRITPEQAVTLRVAGRRLGLIVDAGDARRRFAACPGHPACRSATVDTRADAGRLAAMDIAGFVHLSGCAKGCAHPGEAATTLVGEAGKYRLVRNGRANEASSHPPLSISEIAAILPFA